MWPEQQLWDSLRPRFQGMGLDPQRVENMLGSGTPDVSYTHGWVELKHIPNWPKRPQTLLKVDFERGQVPWLSRRWAAGGLCWVMVRVGSEMFMFSGWDSQLLAAGIPRGLWYQTSAWCNGGRWTDDLIDPLEHLLTGDLEEMSPFLRARFCRLLCRKTIAEVAEELRVSSEQLVAAECGNNNRLLNDLTEFWEA